MANDKPTVEITDVRFRRVTAEHGRFPKSRIYIWPQGESVLDNLVNRCGRPHQLYRREVLPQLFDKLGLPKDFKVNWSQHAGCSMCPCSPGFVCALEVVNAAGFRADIHVDVRGAESTPRDITGAGPLLPAEAS